MIKAGREVFPGLPAEVTIRNEARVALRYGNKFGVACPPYESAKATINCFVAMICCLGMRRETDSRWRVYARDRKTFGVTPDHGRCIDDQ